MCQNPPFEARACSALDSPSMSCTSLSLPHKSFAPLHSSCDTESQTSQKSQPEPRISRVQGRGNRGGAANTNTVAGHDRANAKDCVLELIVLGHRERVRVSCVDG
eukprot:4492385-Prymnesium_polylepis.1